MFRDVLVMRFMMSRRFARDDGESPGSPPEETAKVQNFFISFLKQKWRDFDW